MLRTGGRLLLTTDFYDDHRANLTYCGPGRHFAVNWNIFDRDLLEQIILEHPGFTVTDPPDLNVDWPVMEEQMLRFHGYPYTSVGRRPDQTVTASAQPLTILPPFGWSTWPVM